MALRSKERSGGSQMTNAGPPGILIEIQSGSEAPRELRSSAHPAVHGLVAALTPVSASALLAFALGLMVSGTKQRTFSCGLRHSTDRNGDESTKQSPEAARCDFCRGATMDDSFYVYALKDPRNPAQAFYIEEPAAR